jgi:hypothetical protein
LKKIIAIAATAALAISVMAAPVAAGNDNQPNENACHGQFVSAFASNGVAPGQVQKATGFPVKYQQQLVRFICSF